MHESESESDLCYKSCGNYIVTMKKQVDTICNESRAGVVDRMHAMFRADKLLVVSIIHKESGKTIDRIQNTTYRHNQIWYEVSKVVSVDNYWSYLDRVCATGIHYFLSREAAFYWNYRNKDGSNLSWYDSGQKLEERTNIGPGRAILKRWYTDGKKQLELNYINGKLHGLYQSWHMNGKKHEECNYVRDKLHGFYRRWYPSGKMSQECSYVDGILEGVYRSWHYTGQKDVVCTYFNGRIV